MDYGVSYEHRLTEILDELMALKLREGALRQEFQHAMSMIGILKNEHPPEYDASAALPSEPDMPQPMDSMRIKEGTAKAWTMALAESRKGSSISSRDVADWLTAQGYKSRDSAVAALGSLVSHGLLVRPKRDQYVRGTRPYHLVSADPTPDVAHGIGITPRD